MRQEFQQVFETYPVLAAMVERLVRAFHPERIYLFGSRARGTGLEDSDFDFFMVVPQSSLPRYRRDQAAFKELIGVGASKDILVWTHDEFDRQRTVLTSLPALVEREGLLLYAA